MNIGIDMRGGDFAPGEAVKGLQSYLSTPLSLADIYCLGEEDRLKALFEKLCLYSPAIHIVHTPEAIGMHEHPTKAFKEKTKSSIVAGFYMLAAGKLDAFISAGNTGAMLVGALKSIKPIPGVLRPAISSLIPKVNGSYGLLVDVGLNADCKPEHLNQFAILGSLYAKEILGIEAPKVALLNMGQEEGKGNTLAQATYQLLKENNQVYFVGNIEGRDLLMDKADVMVCEGFTGNVILKMAESLYNISLQRNINDGYLKRFDYEKHGGTPVLGIAKPVIIGHGISNANAFYNMILLAEKMLQTNICGKIVESFIEPASQ